MNSINQIAEQLLRSEKFTLVGHAIPDGDCIGSLLGLYMGLEVLKKDVQIALQDPVPNLYHYLKCSEKVKSPEQLTGEVGTVIFLDCSDEQRVGDRILSRLQERSGTINIDHHDTNEFFGDYNYVDAEAGATAEIIYEILQCMKITVTREIADALYAGIIMDTGRFLNSNTTGKTMQIAGALLEKGANVDEARVRLFESKSQKEILLIRQALQNIEFSDDGKIAWMRLSYQEVKAIGALDFHPEGIINYTRMISGVEIGMLFRESSPGIVKIGFRSRGEADVAVLAKEFGGGGHKRAAGATEEGSLEEVCKIVISKAMDVIR